MSSTNVFLKYCKEIFIGNWSIIDWESKFILSKHDVLLLNKDIPIYDGRDGGLVLGNLHVNGGIHLLQPDSENSKFTYVGEMEGWEYLSSPIKNKEHQEKFSEINNRIEGFESSISTEFEIPENCKKIEVKNEGLNIILVSFYSQCIVNRQSTKEYIDEIIQLEKIFANKA